MPWRWVRASCFVFSWLLQDVESFTHWAVPDTLGNFGVVRSEIGADPGTHTHLITNLERLIVC
jgi:hypothetical protein